MCFFIILVDSSQKPEQDSTLSLKTLQQKGWQETENVTVPVPPVRLVLVQLNGFILK